MLYQYFIGISRYENWIYRPLSVSADKKKSLSVAHCLVLPLVLPLVLTLVLPLVLTPVNTSCTGAEEQFLSKGGPPNKKNEIWLIFKNFSSYIPNSKGGPRPPGPPGSAAPVYASIVSNSLELIGIRKSTGI